MPSTLEIDQTGYRQICKEYDLPIFYQPWWLDAVCIQGQWRAIWVKNKKGIVEGIWPYCIQKHWGFTRIVTPMLTPMLGPWLFYPYAEKLDRSTRDFEFSVYPELIEQFPLASMIQVKCPPQLKNWLPFAWTGFKQTTRYSFVLSDLANLQTLFSHFSPKVRNHIQAASSLLKLNMHVTDSLLELYRLMELTFAKKRLKMPFSLAFLQKLDTAVTENAQRQIITVADQDGKIHAAAYVLYDKTTAYLLLLGSNPSIRHRGAISLAIWEAIQQASRKVGSFDFEGSMLPGAAKVFAMFGGDMQPYFMLTRFKNHALNVAYQWLRG
jgi:hypothetical protein